MNNAEQLLQPLKYLIFLKLCGWSRILRHCAAEAEFAAAGEGPRTTPLTATVVLQHELPTTRSQVGGTGPGDQEEARGQEPRLDY